MPDAGNMSQDIAIAAIPENGCTVRAVSRVRPMQRVTTDKDTVVTTDFIRLVLRHANPVRLTPPVRALKAVMQEISPANPVIIDQIIISVLLALQMQHVQVQVLPVTPDIKKKVILA